jgi:hypothetical protein
MGDRLARAKARRIATAGAVAVTGFRCGWQATGVTGGAVMAAALAAGVSPAVFTDRREPLRRRCVKRNNEARH